jgi:hypothetical protein
MCESHFFTIRLEGSEVHVSPPPKMSYPWFLKLVPTHGKPPFQSMAIIANSCGGIDVPTMSGLGGNLILFPPSGLIAIRFADADNYQPEPMVWAAEHYRSSCHGAIPLRLARPSQCGAGT